MRILLSVENFNVFGGTESYMLTVAQRLERLGHPATIYTPNPGPAAQFAREQGIRVADAAELPAEVDAIFSQDASTAYELAGRYPSAARVFVAHSADYVITEVPQLAGVCHAVVTLNDRVDRWVGAHAGHPPITRLRQPIDLARFRSIDPPQAQSRRVLITSNNLRGSRAAAIEAACERNGFEVSWIGATSHPTSRPERAIARAEIVIGAGRSALEAMAASRATFVYGVVGCDGWVTPESYARLEADGFAGLATDMVGDTDTVAEALGEWRHEMGQANRDLACAHHSAPGHVIELVKLAEHVGRANGCPRPALPTPTEELARLVRLEWLTFGRLSEAIYEAHRLRGENARLLEALGDEDVLRAENARLLEALAQAEALRAENDRLAAVIADQGAQLRSTQERLTATLAMRRHRLARRIAAPLDKARAARGALSRRRAA
jgi:hypothetical protein